MKFEFKLYRDPLFVNDFEQEPAAIPQNIEQHDLIETEDFKILPECIFIDNAEESPTFNISSSSSSSKVIKHGDPGPSIGTTITCTSISNPNLAVQPKKPKMPKKVITQFKSFIANLTKSLASTHSEFREKV